MATHILNFMVRGFFLSHIVLYSGFFILAVFSGGHRHIKCTATHMGASLVDPFARGGLFL